MEMFEFDESDVWTSSYQLSAAIVPNKIPSVRKFNAGGGGGGTLAPAAAAARSSLPVNIPDWSKIMKKEGERYRTEHGRSKQSNMMSDEEEESYRVDAEQRIPPHEYLAMRRGASFSVHEGIGRTLKGRDLRQVRNAVWKKVGFED